MNLFERAKQEAKERKKLKKLSAGIAILWKDKVLLAHPKNASWFKTYTPPKGEVEPGEEWIDAAIRETFEETGISVEKSSLTEEPIQIPYINSNGNLYKIVVLFPFRISKLREIGISSEKVPIEQLQLSEIDDARFMSAEEFKERVLPRYYEPLKKLIENEKT
jgi:8-oxo-dGTP pyrophosphatase MutT (NUDIX family)